MAVYANLRPQLVPVVPLVVLPLAGEAPDAAVLPAALVEDVAGEVGGHHGSVDAASCVVCVTPAIPIESVAADDAMPVAIPSLMATGAVNSGFEPSSATGLYRIAPGMRRPVRVLRFSGTVYWMVASGHSLWIDVNHGGESATLWRLSGATGTPVFHVDSNFSVGYDEELGYGEPSYAGNAAIGIWTVPPPLTLGELQQGIVHIDATTGQASRVATIPAVAGYAAPTLVSFRGSLYFIHLGALYRVTPE